MYDRDACDTYTNTPALKVTTYLTIDDAYFE